MNIYIVHFRNGWRSLQIADSPEEAGTAAIQCWYCWFTDFPDITYVKQLGPHQ